MAIHQPERRHAADGRALTPFRSVSGGRGDTRGMDKRILAVPLAAVAALTAGCGGAKRGASPPATTATTASPHTTTSTKTTGASALQAEANSAAAGDIPDNQVFLTYRDRAAGYSMTYPEGWAQQGSASKVTFRDKNNVIRAVVSPGAAWTKASVAADVRALKGAQLQGGPQTVTLSGKPAFKVVYRTVSAPNAVTGKRVTLTVDRYYVWKPGRRAVLDLGSPVGVDNVDAYRMISESFRWS